MTEALPQRKKLEDQGSRFQHLADFQDYIGDGLLVVNNSYSAHKNAADKMRGAQLEIVLRFTTAYQESLALDKTGRNYMAQKFDINRLIDSNQPSKETLATIRTEVQTAAKIAPKDLRIVDQKAENDAEDDAACA
jgi:hypothetical protein